MKTPLLEFNNVTVMRDKAILDNISFAVNEGEHTAILGPNGSGKSTLLKLISRRIYPLADTPGFAFRIWGRDSWDVFELRKMLGIVSADIEHDFEESMTVYEAVLSGFFSSVGLFHVRLTKEMKKTASREMEFMGIEHLSGRSVTELSSGELRKTLIARALVHGPKALILDEPLNSLDIVAAARFRLTMEKLSSKVTLIIATHDLNDVLPEVKRVIMIKEGRVFMDGKKSKIINSKNMSDLFGGKVTVKKIGGIYAAY
jgi:iron complex transport system ATP-binding protein